jgi:solute carrier family 35 protein F3/4
LQLAIGALIVVGVAVSWAGATQFSKSALSDKPSTFYAPYFIVWFNTNFMIFCYPVYVLYALVLNLLRNEDANTPLKEIHKYG